MRYDNAIMLKLAAIAEIHQGLARTDVGAGIRKGQWPIHLAESSDIQHDGWLNLKVLRKIEVSHSRRMDRHLLYPYDLLVTARAGTVQTALVPPQVFQTMAGITLLVVRTKAPDSGMGHYLWYFLTSTYGRRQLIKRLTVNATITTLSASALGEVEVPIPSPQELELVARLVEASEEAYASAVKAAMIRRETVRDSIIERFIPQDAGQRV